MERLLGLLALAFLTGCASPARGWVVGTVATHHFDDPPGLTSEEQKANAYGTANHRPEWQESNPGLGWEQPFGPDSWAEPFWTVGVVRNSRDVVEVYGGVGGWVDVCPGVRFGGLAGLHYHERLDEVPAGPWLLIPAALEFTLAERVGAVVGWIPGSEGGALVFQLRARLW